MRTMIAIQCPECGYTSAEYLRGLDDDEPDLAVCTECELEWELT